MTELSPFPCIDNLEPALRHCWHPVARVEDVGAGPIPVLLLGQRWVLARLGGQWVAMEDRCPHRLAPLSAGRVVGDALQCAYHGYRFDAAGRCIGIPAQAPGVTIPRRTARRLAAAVCERYGLLWLAPEAPEVDILEIPEWKAPGYTAVPIEPDLWRAGAAQMTDNFLDVGHFPFVHAASFGDPDDVEVADYAVEPLGDGFRAVHRHVARERLAGSGQAQPRTQTFTYTPPFGIHLRIDYPASGSTLAIVFAMQPVDAERTRLYCYNFRNDIEDGRSSVEATRRRHVAIANEDRALLESFPQKWMPLDLRAETHSRADRITTELRRALARLVARHAPAAAGDTTEVGSNATP